MRRLASDVLRNLEMRVARLERQAKGRSNPQPTKRDDELKKLEGIFSGKELAKYPHFESAKEAVVSYLEDDGIRWSSMVIITDVKEKGDVVFFKVHHPVSAYENGKDVTYLKHFDVSMEYNSSVKEWMSIRDVR